MEKFDKLEVQPDVLKAIEEMGYTTPTEIQEKAIPILSGTNKDFIGQAQTGTGKTAAFVIPLLEKIDFKDSSVQALILAPTRELAMQVENEIGKLGKYTKVRSTCIYGGAPYDKQLRELKRGPQIVVGTPGRVIDHIKRGTLKLKSAKFCVLDEADEMLNMGFFEDVQMILDIFNEERQLVMFSATMPQGILKLIKKSFNEYEMVKIANKSLSNDDIEQRYFIVRDRYFKEALNRIIDSEPDIYTIVFCKTRLETKQVGDDLRERGHNIEVLNGDMGQSERALAMKNFKDKKVKIMVCTDVAARGIDVNNLTHVINYGLPQDNESYVHRIGRTGRAGLKGKAYTIVGPRATFAMKRIEKHINKKIELAKLPTVKDLKENAVQKEIDNGAQLLEKIQNKGDNFDVDVTFGLFKDKFGELDQDGLLKLMFTWKLNNTLKRYDSLSDIETEAQAGGGSGRDDFGGRRRRRDRDFRSGGGRSGGGRSEGRRSEGGGRSEGRRFEGRRSEGGGRPEGRRSEGGARPEGRRSEGGGRPEGRRSEGGRKPAGRSDGRRSEGGGGGRKPSPGGGKRFSKGGSNSSPRT